MAKSSLAIFTTLVFLLLTPPFAAAGDLEDRYEELLEENGFVVKQAITVTSPTYFKVEAEALDNVTLKCTAYFMEEVKLSDTYRLTPDDEEIVFRIPDSKVNRFVCVKAEEGK